MENTNNSYNSFDILSEFDNIEINNNSRISNEDTQYCEEQQNQFDAFIDFSNKYINYLNEVDFANTYYNSQCLINEMKKEQNNKKCMFINKIVNHFKDTYKVTLSSESLIQKSDITIDYNTIVSEVIEQLGGHNFTDKAEKEIKDSLIECVKYHKIKLNNKKISIDSFFGIDWFTKKYGNYEVSYSSDNDFYKLFKAMSHFLYNSNENRFDILLNTITRERDDEVFKTHDITSDKANALKLYKNGKIDIEFTNNQYARQFAKEYCGYIEKVA